MIAVKIDVQVIYYSARYFAGYRYYALEYIAGKISAVLLYKMSD